VVETSKTSHDPWARKCQDFRIEDKEALALLLRCRIISQQEFATSDASQEHFEECLWIARTMLQEKSLDEWVELSEQSRQSFQESVRAAVAARQAASASTAQPGINSPRDELQNSNASTMSGGTAVTFRPSTHDNQDSRSSLVSFNPTSHDSQDARSSLASDAQKALAEKSPVPLVNCHDEEVASSADSTHIEDQDDQLSELFPSLFTSDSWHSSAGSPQPSWHSSAGSPQLASEHSSPGSEEYAKAPISPFDPRMRPTSQEVLMAAPANTQAHVLMPRATKVQQRYDCRNGL
jgi:hypothetical protein